LATVGWSVGGFDERPVPLRAAGAMIHHKPFREARWQAKAGLKGLNELLLKGQRVKYCC
jgi:hypothetical protein